MVNSHIHACSDTHPGRRWSITSCLEQRRAWRSASHQEEVAEVILLVSQPAWRSTAFSLWLSWAVLPGAQALRCEEASSPVENSRGLSPLQAGPAPASTASRWGKGSPGRRPTWPLSPWLALREASVHTSQAQVPDAGASGHCHGLKRAQP